MAYTGHFNPDALPAFAEPERKTTSSSSKPATASSSAQANQQPNSSYSQTPTIPRQYGSKPPPPLPNQHRHDSHGGQGGRSGQDGELRGNMNTSTQGRRMSPAPQLPSSYEYHAVEASFAHRTGPGAASRPQAVSRPPATPAPRSNSDMSMLPLFRAVDKNGSGQLSERELGAALVNGDWTPFDPHTVRLMIRMFDTDRSGTIGYTEFCGLWGFLANWRTLFDRFDVDRSGNISLDEFADALNAFGYRLGDGFIRFLFGVYDKDNRRSLSFDLFVQSMISLKRMTDVFKRYDDDRDGYITLSFEEFLMEILQQSFADRLINANRM